jgi:formylglycine-generating enzyme required for sulfatase activity
MTKERAFEIFNINNPDDLLKVDGLYDTKNKALVEQLENAKTESERDEVLQKLYELDMAYEMVTRLKPDIKPANQKEKKSSGTWTAIIIIISVMSILSKINRIIHKDDDVKYPIYHDFYFPQTPNPYAEMLPDSSETESGKVKSVSAGDHDGNPYADKNLERAMIDPRSFDYADSTLGLNLQMTYICATANESSHVGSNTGKLDQYPEHEVKADDYYLGKYEVTQKQWRLIMGNDPGYFAVCDSCPVENVSWFEVQLFIEKLNELSGLNYRLPSEAEWEIATRGGDAPHVSLANYANEDVGIPKWHFDRAWYAENSSSKTHKVGQKKPSNELFDMSGNVLEWCEDDWHDNYEGAPSYGTAWKDGTPAAYRVARGRSWKDDIILDYQIYRHKLDPKMKYNNVGFRLARDGDEVL